MNILLMLAHSIEEYDQVRLLSELGYSVLSIGSYLDPAHPIDDKRPPLPDVPYYFELARLVDGDHMKTKANLPDAIIDWADVIIVHHFPEKWIAPQWDRISRKRVIWRTVGQSNRYLEEFMRQGRERGLQIVRYSPAERRGFNGVYAGEDALIRFWKDPDEWFGWNGEQRTVLNVTQDLVKRADACHYDWWNAATRDLPRLQVGPGSEALGGPGNVCYCEMRGILRDARCYLYTGTQPASYTLGLIEAMMTGCPIVSIGPALMRNPDLFEAHDFANAWSDDPRLAGEMCRRYLDDADLAAAASAEIRARAIELFGRETIAAQWTAFLG